MVVRKNTCLKMISRKFSLKSNNRKVAVSKVNIGLAKAKALANVYVRDMITHINSNTLNVASLASESKKVVRSQIYDGFQYSKMVSPAFSKYPKPLHERVKQAAFYRALTMTRLWLIRNHNLEICIDNLVRLFNNDKKTSFRFLEGKNLYGSAIKPFYNALAKDVFGNDQVMTNFFLNNHLKQVKNLLINSNDPALISHIKGTVSTLQNVNASKQILNSFAKRVIDSFKAKRKGVYVSVGERGVPSHLMTEFFKKISKTTTYDAQNIISLKKRIAKLEKKIKNCKNRQQKGRLTKRKGKAARSLKVCGSRLNKIIPELKISISGLRSSKDLKEFKKALLLRVCGIRCMYLI